MIKSYGIYRLGIGIFAKEDRPGRKEVGKEGEQRVKASAGAPSLAAVSAN